MIHETELEIVALGVKGDGIAYHNERPVFAPGALSGERVRATLSGQHASVEEILKSSPDRVASLCPHFPTCGGCRMQHLSMNAYTAWKIGQLEALLTREGVSAEKILPCQTSAPATRRRARLAVANHKGGLELGFNQSRSHSIINLETCSVLEGVLVDLINELRPYLKHWMTSPKAVGDVQITALADGIDVVLIGGCNKLSLDMRQDLAAMAQELELGQLSWRRWDRSPVEPIAHRSSLMVRHGDTFVPFPPGSFLQATTSGEKALIDFATQSIGNCGKALDLFCGLGGFGLSLPKTTRVTFSDLDGPAIEALEKAVKSEPRCQTEQRDLMRDPFSSIECADFDAVIYDPPRGGAKAQTEQLAVSKVPQIVAISCDPVSFVRDAKILMAGGYALKTLLPVDQFLWSTHMEIAAHFVR